MQKKATKESKITNGEHFNKVWKSSGKKPEELIAPSIPNETKYLWQWFISVFSGEVLTFQEIKAWAELNNITLVPGEADLLKAISVAWVNTMQED